MKKKNVLSEFWKNAMLNGVFKAVVNIGDRTVGYVVKHPVKKENVKAAGNRATNNHRKKSSKARRLMAKESRKINR